jgi:hypothetical protein
MGFESWLPRFVSSRGGGGTDFLIWKMDGLAVEIELIGGLGRVYILYFYLFEIILWFYS